MSQQNIDLIIKELRSLDYNAYLCATLCHKNDFHKVACILLLQAELRKIADITDEDMVGMIRLAWWKESLEEIFQHNRSKKHHLLEEILHVKDEIDGVLLMKAFEGFESDFSEDKKFQSKAQLDDYIFRTYEVFLLLIVRMLKGKDETLAKNLALIDFNFDLLKKIRSEDEKVTRFFYPAFFEELEIEAASWKKNEDEDNLLVIVAHLYEQINMAAKEIKKSEKSLKKNLKNLTLRKDLVQIIVRDLPKKKCDVFSISLSAKRLSVKLRFLSKIW